MSRNDFSWNHCCFLLYAAFAWRNKYLGMKQLNKKYIILCKFDRIFSFRWVQLYSQITQGVTVNQNEHLIQQHKISLTLLVGHSDLVVRNKFKN